MLTKDLASAASGLLPAFLAVSVAAYLAITGQIRAQRRRLMLQRSRYVDGVETALSLPGGEDVLAAIEALEVPARPKSFERLQTIGLLIQLVLIVVSTIAFIDCMNVINGASGDTAMFSGKGVIIILVIDLVFATFVPVVINQIALNRDSEAQLRDTYEGLRSFRTPANDGGQPPEAAGKRS